jgi:hypothetical protein
MIIPHTKVIHVFAGHLANKLPSLEEIGSQCKPLDTGEASKLDHSIPRGSSFSPLSSSPVFIIHSENYSRGFYIHPQLARFFHKWGIDYMRNYNVKD